MENFLNRENVHEAINKLNEPCNFDDRQREIKKLRNLYNTKGCGIKLFDESDGFLLKFLRARLFKEDKALKLLNGYHTYFKNWPELFEKVKNPQSVKHVFEAGCFIALNGKAVDGSAVCISRPGKLIDINIIDYIAAIIISLEILLKEESNQIYGITLVFDRNYLTYGFVQQLNPSMVQQVIDLFQNVLPIRIKSMNFINDSKCFQAVFSILSLFINKSLKDLIILHEKNFNLFYKVVEASLLPPDYEGTGPDIDNVAERWKKTVFGEKLLSQQTN